MNIEKHAPLLTEVNKVKENKLLFCFMITVQNVISGTTNFSESICIEHLARKWT